MEKSLLSVSMDTDGTIGSNATTPSNCDNSNKNNHTDPPNSNTITITKLNTPIESAQTRQNFNTHAETQINSTNSQKSSNTFIHVKKHSNDTLDQHTLDSNQQSQQAQQPTVSLISSCNDNTEKNKPTQKQNLKSSGQHNTSNVSSPGTPTPTSNSPPHPHPPSPTSSSTPHPTHPTTHCTNTHTPPSIELSNIEPFPQSTTTTAAIQRFVFTSTQFLNAFAADADQRLTHTMTKINQLEQKLQGLEAMIMNSSYSSLRTKSSTTAL
mmetsp:Transcript_15463/g.22050  ORF Transcript_15463/g.22050 Transcript_15463/m.22050 type:complete len:267 (-) Transcript_15463:226-1026(-)|eukprot:CAMPEP_0184870942 /NCGR_PEP_ID=MMETSP0580-20130426/39307_1 /TAXON_ID=1118495 /ORGANISM="Dactyliosolen fragilissimus" /LENGTH=266 /DNA_ID=CAMNT_0027373335 /DNA_START=63 /DNA_END=863 /DNA_ORIENTATION=+